MEEPKGNLYDFTLVVEPKTFLEIGIDEQKILSFSKPILLERFKDNGITVTSYENDVRIQYPIRLEPHESQIRPGAVMYHISLKVSLDHSKSIPSG